MNVIVAERERCVFASRHMEGSKEAAEQEVIVEMTLTGLHLPSSQLLSSSVNQRYKSPCLTINVLKGIFGAVDESQDTLEGCK